MLGTQRAVTCAKSERKGIQHFNEMFLFDFEHACCLKTINIQTICRNHYLKKYYICVEYILTKQRRRQTETDVIINLGSVT